MSLPEICIRRPVMTTLLMLSFIAAGLFGYRQLPIAALPRVDFPTIQVTATLPGASPEFDGGLGCDPAGAAVRHHRRDQLDDLGQLARQHPDHPAIRPRPRHRRRRARRAVRPDHRRPPAARRNDHAAELPQGQSGRLARAVHRTDVDVATALYRQRIWRHGHRAADFLAAWRCPGQHFRLAEIRRPRPGRSEGAGGRRSDLGRCAAGAGRREHQQAARLIERRHAVADAPGQWAAEKGCGLRRATDRLSERPSCAPAGRRHRHRQRREQPDRKLVQRHALDPPGHLPPARRQHRRRRRQHQGGAAGPDRAGAAVHRRHRADRPLAIDPRRRP